MDCETAKSTILFLIMLENVAVTAGVTEIFSVNDLPQTTAADIDQSEALIL